MSVEGHQRLGTGPRCLDLLRGDLSAIIVAVEVDVDPFSHFSASSLKLLDPTTDDGEAELSFLGGANGRSFGRSVDIFSVSGFAGISSPPDFSPLLNRETFIFVSLLMDEVEEPEMDEFQLSDRNLFP